MNSVHYVHLANGGVTPALPFGGAFKAVVVVEDDVDFAWQDTVSEWLVRSGCRYMMAWGRKCSEWDDSVDHADRVVFGDGMPDDNFVMTTWHDEEPLDEVFWFSEFAAMHPSVELPHTLILHIAPSAGEVAMLQKFQDALEADPP